MKMKLLLFLSLTAFTWAQSVFPPASGGGSGTVTSVATTSPITGGTFTDTGTIACATCVVGPASATDGAIVLYDGTTGKLTKNSQITIDTTAGRAGGYNMPQGTAATPGTTSVLVQAPAAVTSYSLLLPASVGATGVLKASVASTTATTSIGQIVNAEITNSTIDLTTKVTGILPSVNGGTGNGFTKFSGPTTSEKTFTVPDASSTLTVTVASGTKALDTDAIASTACDTLATTTATGAASTDVLIITPNADITAVTGYAPVTTGGLQVFYWLTANTINWKICNPTSSSITPGAVTLNYRIVR